jgi:hypothetical protein
MYVHVPMLLSSVSATGATANVTVQMSVTDPVEHEAYARRNSGAAASSVSVVIAAIVGLVIGILVALVARYRGGRHVTAGAVAVAPPPATSVNRTGGGGDGSIVPRGAQRLPVVDDDMFDDLDEMNEFHPSV